MERVKVTIYTDPGCPFGFNAQRQELQLLWHYGERLDVTRMMIVLTEKSSSYEERGLKPEMVVANAKRLRASYGMPMLTEPRDRLVATIQACRAYVGARIHGDARADLLLRALRRRAFSLGQALDELETIYGAGQDSGIAPEELDSWLADEFVERALREDMAATRAPLPEALALPQRLSRSNGGLRYSTASAAFARRDGATMAACYAPGARFSDPVFTSLRDDEPGAMWRMLTGRAKDLEVTLVEHQAADERGSAHWLADYTFSTGRRVHNDVRAEFRFEHGLIAGHQDSFSFYAWARQALGPAGLALGWTPMVRTKVRREARSGLDDFLAQARG